MLLLVILGLPLVGAIAVALMPRKEAQACRHMGLFFSVLTTFASFGILRFWKNLGDGGIQLETNVSWIKSLGINFHVGVDGISLWLVILTTVLTPIVILATYKHVETRVKDLVIALLVLEVAMIGALIALDMFLFYLFWEIMLIPMYLMIGVWGHDRKIYASIKFVIYTMVGSLLMLVAIIYMYITHGQATGDYTFDFLILNQTIWGKQAQLWLFLAFALAFAIKVPLFPLHTWLPDAHTMAPTAGSMILAGVLLKMGTYGLLRFAIPMFPTAAAACAPYLVILSVIGIVYGAMVAYAQRDAKRLVAYSSVSHLGFVMLGLLAMNATGLEGSIMQMVNHGISTAGLFFAIGILYDRRHTHELNQFGGIWKSMPVFGALFMIMMLSSVGLPGLNGFVGEFLILVGAFTSEFNPVFETYSWTTWGVPWKIVAVVSATGVVLGAIYLLHLFQKLMFGPITHNKNASLADVSAREILTFVPLVLLCFGLGIYPKPFLRTMDSTVALYLKEYRVKATAGQNYEGPPKRLAQLAYRNHYPIQDLSAPRAGANRLALKMPTANVGAPKRPAAARPALGKRPTLRRKASGRPGVRQIPGKVRQLKVGKQGKRVRLPKTVRAKRGGAR